MTSPDSGWMALLQAQDGVISRDQLLQHGKSARQIRYGVSTGVWAWVLPGVFRSALIPVTLRGRLRAASLWAGPRGTISGWSAAWWWRLCEEDPIRPEVTIPHATRRKIPPHITVVRRDLDPKDRCLQDGLAVTRKPLSALYGAIALGDRGPAMLDRALQKEITYRDLHAAYCRQIGWHGSTAAHRLMAAAGDGAAAISERLMIKLLKDADLHGWRINRPMAANATAVTPDFRFDRSRLILEIDGWAWHHQQARFQRDRSRQNDVQLEGWLVLRFTWYDLTQCPAESLGKIRLALAQRD